MQANRQQLDHLPSRPALDDNRLPKALNGNEGAIWAYLDFHPDQVIFEEETGSPIPGPLMRFSQHKFALIGTGKPIGSGAWGDVYTGLLYDREHPENNHKPCVVKKYRPLPPTNIGVRFKRWIVNPIDPLTQMQAESVKMRSIHDLGEVRETYENGAHTIGMLMPYLGKMSLSTLKRDPQKVKSISVDEWLDFFILAVEKTIAFHEKSQGLHGDINDDNVVVYLYKDATGQIRFHPDYVNLIDFGTARKKDERGPFGRFNCAAPENLFSFAHPFADESADIFSLGITLAEYAAQRENLCDKHHKIDKAKLRSAKNQFLAMAGLRSGGRPTLEETRHRLREIKAGINLDRKSFLERHYKMIVMFGLTALALAIIVLVGIFTFGAGSVVLGALAAAAASGAGAIGLSIGFPAAVTIGVIATTFAAGIAGVLAGTICALVNDGINKLIAFFTPKPARPPAGPGPRTTSSTRTCTRAFAHTSSSAPAASSAVSAAVPASAVQSSRTSSSSSLSSSPSALHSDSGRRQAESGSGPAVEPVVAIVSAAAHAAS